MSDKATAQTEDLNSEITVSFTLNEVDCRNAVTAMIEHCRSQTYLSLRKSRYLLVLMPIAAIFIVFIVYIRDRSLFTDPGFLWPLLIVYFFLFAYWCAIYRRTFPSVVTGDAIEASLNTLAIEQLIGSWQVSLTAAGVNFVSPDSSEQRTWRSISHFSSLGEFVVIAFHIRPEVHIPCRAFENHNAAERFIRSGNARLAASGENVERRVIRWLSRHDLPCPKCTYNLHDVTELKCPECGHALEKKEYPDAFRHQDAAYL